MTRTILALSCLLALAIPPAARADAPTIASATPGAVAPGRTTDLTLRGGALSGATGVWSSFPGDVKLVTTDAGSVTCRFTLPPDAQVGVAAVRLATRGGASNLLPIMVDDLPGVPEAPSHSTPATAQAIATGSAVDGACDAGAHDYYRLPVRKGQRVSVEVVAARLGSQLDPVVRLLDSTGRELAWCDDAPGAASDCRLAHTFDADGQCLIELRDANYAGGADYRYRLRVGDFPLPAVPYPLGGKAGTVAMFSFAGTDCADAVPVTIKLPADRKSVTLGARYAGERGRSGGSAFASATVGQWDEMVEAEPNDKPESATPLPGASVAFSGRLQAPRDRDFFLLPAKKGQRLAMRARTRSLGSPCDVVLRLYKPDGSKLTESKVEAASEGTLDAAVPEDGNYRLSVEDISGAGGPVFAYRIEIEPYRPGFLLSVDTDKVDAKPGEAFDVKITTVRRDYAGPIALRVEGISSATLDGATIATGKNDTTLKVKMPADLAAHPAGPISFRIIGQAKVGDDEVIVTASTMPALRRLFPRMLYPPEELDGVIALGIRTE
jgi:hypothetical protein